VIWRDLVDEARSRVSVAWHVWRQENTYPGWPGIPRASDAMIVGAAIAGLEDDFRDAPHRLTGPQATLMYAWVADGTIADGGLPALVETLGDRGAAVADAFAALGLPGRADVVRRTLELYPTAGATSPDERLSAWDTWAAAGPEETELERLESRYRSLSATEAVDAAGARFVTDHPADFPARA
jgi:hypothetical protein